MVSAPGGCASACVALAQRLGGDAIRDADPQLRDAAARRIFDTLGALSVGRRVAASGVGPVGVGPVGWGPGAGPVARIRELVAVTRCSEIDDVDARSLVTPGSVVVPAALVLAAESGADGPALLRAVVAGYETMIVLGEGLDGPRLLGRGVWPTYLLAPAAVAAVAASLWELDAARTAEALAIALARAAGVPGRPPGVPTSRWWLCGSAAGDGVLAAEAAAAGLAGDPQLLDRGLGADGTIGFDPARLRAGDPVRLTVVESKPFCAARQVLPAVAAAQVLRERIAGERVAAVTVAVPAAYRAMVDRAQPGDRTSSLQSAQFQVAAALAADPALHDPLRCPPALGDGADRLMRATSVTEDPALSRRYPAIWSARVTVRTEGGGELSELVEQDPGGRRQSTWDELAGKYLRAGSPDAALTAARTACQELPSAALGAAGRLTSAAAASDDQDADN